MSPDDIKDMIVPAPIEVHVVEGLVVKPGDRLLVTMANLAGEALIKEIRSALQAAFPGTVLVILVGATAVQQPGAQLDDPAGPLVPLSDFDGTVQRYAPGRRDTPRRGQGVRHRAGRRPRPA
jgi:hypothetical protein